MLLSQLHNEKPVYSKRKSKISNGVKTDLALLIFILLSYIMLLLEVAVTAVIVLLQEFLPPDLSPPFQQLQSPKDGITLQNRGGGVLDSCGHEKFSATSLRSVCSVVKYLIKMATHSRILASNPVDRGAWWVAVHGVAKESDTTERLNSK